MARTQEVARWTGGLPLPAEIAREPARNHPLWSTSAPLDASTFDLLEVTVSGLEHSELVLLWVPRDPAPGLPPGRLALQGEFAPGSETKTFSFDLRGSPAWQGAVIGASLHTDAASRRSAEVREVRALRRSLDPERLATAARQAWKVSLGGELRNALLATSAVASRRSAVSPSDGVLTFGFGVPQGQAKAVRFLVGARRSAGPVTPVFERTLGPAERERWFDVTVDLASFAGESIDLELSASTADGSPPLAFFADPVAAGPYAGAAPDILLVSIDTLRADRLSMSGYGRRTTPKLDHFAAERAVRFSDAIAQAPSTLPSHASLFTGLDAFRHGANHDPAADDLWTIAEALRGAGYRTLATTGGAKLHPRYALTQGFDVYRHWRQPERRDDELEAGLADIRRWLAEPRTLPRFLVLHTYEVHSPYRARQPFFRQLFPDRADPGCEVQMRTPAPDPEEGHLARLTADYVCQDRRTGAVRSSEPAIASALYDSAIAYADDRIGGLLEELARRGALDRMVVAVVSDHGESFGEHGMGMHGHLYDDNLRVPLLLAAPGRGFEGRTIDAQIRLMDLMPTLLELAGQPVPGQLDAVSLLPLLAGRASVPDEAWSYAVDANRGISLRSRGRLKYLFNNTAWAPLLGREEVYDLRSDPGELADRSAGFGDLEKLRAAVASTLHDAASGWRLSVRNADSTARAGRILGPIAAATRLRAEGPSTVALRATGHAASFELAPGESSIWLLDGAPVGPLRVQWGDAAILEIELPQPPGKQGWLVSGEGWRPVAGRLPNPGETGVGLEYRGSVSARRRAQGPVEEEHMRQLAALGYLR